MSKSIKEIAQIAAEWWADKVINPKFDNGDTENGGFFGMAFATMATQPVSNQSRDKFVSFLVSNIEEKLKEESGKWLRRIDLDVDYGPCKILSDAAVYSGVSQKNFPWKTVMWIDKNHISARYGYGGKYEYLYTNKAYWKDRIDSAKAMIDEYKTGNALLWIQDEEERKVKINDCIDSLMIDIDDYQKEIEKAEA